MKKLYLTIMSVFIASPAMAITAQMCDSTGNCQVVPVPQVSQEQVLKSDDDPLCSLSSKPFGICITSYCEFCNIDKLPGGSHLSFGCQYASDSLPKPQFFHLETKKVKLRGAGPQMLHGSYHIIMHDQFESNAANAKNGFYPKSFIDKYFFSVTKDPTDPGTSGRVDIRDAYFFLNCSMLSAEQQSELKPLPTGF